MPQYDRDLRPDLLVYPPQCLLRAAPIKVRGGGYGLDAELAQKAAQKYDPELGEPVCPWVVQKGCGSAGWWRSSGGVWVALCVPWTVAERTAQKWIEDVLGEPFPGDFSAGLKDGQRLCRLINAIKPVRAPAPREGRQAWGFLPGQSMGRLPPVAMTPCASTLPWVLVCRAL